MADYYPLLARALDAMPDRSAALRKAVYDRARGALIGQLRSLEPPLSEADITLESEALEAAIGRIESEHGGAPAVVANDAAPPIFPPAPDRDSLPEAEAPPQAAEGTRSGVAREPALPPASQPDLGPRPTSRIERQAAIEPAPPVEASTPVIPIKPRKAKLDDKAKSNEKAKSDDKAAERAAVRAAREAARQAARVAPKDDEPKISTGSAEQRPTADAIPSEGAASEPSPAGEPPAADRETVTAVQDAAGGRHRPRIDVVAPRRGRPKLVRNVFVGGVLLVVVGLIAVAAFMLRDKPSDLQPGNAEAQNEATESGTSKYADRIGGDAAPSAERRDPSARQGQAASGDDATRAAAQPDVAVAQRAVLFEENPAGGNAQPITHQGMVVWRLEAVNGEQGQPLETVVRARLNFAEAGLSLVMTLRRNLEPALPASHTIELAFTTTSPAGDTRAVQDVGLLTAKDEEGARGSPVSGLPVRVRENLFLIGLSSLPADIERNTDLLENRNWFDLPVKFASGPRGVLTFEKGTSGSQVIRSAFEQWRR